MGKRRGAKRLDAIANKIRRFCKESTGALRAKYPGGPQRGKGPSPTKKEEAILEAAKKVGGCEYIALLCLLRAVTGLPLRSVGSGPGGYDIDDGEICDEICKVGVVVVPLETSGGHDYPVGSPTMIVQNDGDGDACGIKIPDGNSGNWLRGRVRLATDKEIDSFFAEVDLSKAEETMRDYGLIFII